MEYLYLHLLFYKRGFKTKTMIQFLIKIPIILQMAFVRISWLILYLAFQIIKMTKNNSRWSTSKFTAAGSLRVNVRFLNKSFEIYWYLEPVHYF